MKIYLKSKVDLNVILSDNTWYFKIGTIFVFEKVGWFVEYKEPSYNSSTQYINTECVRINKIIYDKKVYLGNEEFGYETTEMETNIINTIFMHTTGSGVTLANYKTFKYSSLEVMDNTDIFEEAIDYKRDDLIVDLIK